MSEQLDALMDELRERQQQVYALANGWSVTRCTMYDEEGIPGWLWTDGNREYCEIEDSDNPLLPTWPDELRRRIEDEMAKR